MKSLDKADGYFPSVASIGGLIVGVENLDGNANVKFRQADTLEKLFSRLERYNRVVIQNFRADCGSFSEEIIKTVSAHCGHFSSVQTTASQDMQSLWSIRTRQKQT